MIIAKEDITEDLLAQLSLLGDDESIDLKIGQDLVRITRNSSYTFCKRCMFGSSMICYLFGKELCKDNYFSNVSGHGHGFIAVKIWK